MYANAIDDKKSIIERRDELLSVNSDLKIENMMLRSKLEVYEGLLRDRQIDNFEDTNYIIYKGCVYRIGPITLHDHEDQESWINVEARCVDVLKEDNKIGFC